MLLRLFSRSSSTYHPLRRSISKDDDDARNFEEEGCEKCNSSSHSQGFQAGVKRFASTNPAQWLLLNLFLLGISLAIWVLALTRGQPISGFFGPSLRNSLLKQTSMYSPILDKIDILFVTKRMNATLVDRPASIWRQEPSPEVDAAWLVAEDPRPFAITRDEVIALGQDPDKAVKWPEDYGLGSDVYAARIDVFHQIHCLDSIRREVYFDYYYGDKYTGGFGNTTKMHKLHLTHCIAYLMENIMCTANVDVYTHFWTDAFPYPHPDFQIEHKYRSFDAVLDWQQRHAVKVHDLARLTKPDDHGPARKMSHEFKDIFRYYETHADDGGDEDGVDA